VTKTSQDVFFMQKALACAMRGVGATRPNPPVGAVVVQGGKIAGRGFHRRAGTDHAEVVALRRAGKHADGGTLYVTLEPCCTTGRTPPCTDAIIQSGITRVVISVRDPNPLHKGRGARILRKAGVEVLEGVCAEDGRRIIAPFGKWITRGIPYVTLKLAMSLDGKIADYQRKSKWITSGQSRRFVHSLRRRVDAVMVGSGTVRDDDPSLLPGNARSANVFRVIVDSQGGISSGARVLTDGHQTQTIIATTRKCPASRLRAYTENGATVWVLPAKGGHVDLRALMARLGKLGLLHVLCEGGGTLSEGLLRADLVDECLFMVAPIILGGTNSVPSIGGRGWKINGCPRLRVVECRMIGRDLAVKAVL